MRIGRDYRIITTRLVPLGLAVALGLGGVARAGDPTDADLQKQVQDLQTEIQELKTEIGTIKAQSEVKAPAAPAGSTAAAPAPTTVGEHVGQIEKDVSDIKTNLSTNLGVHVHALVDANYEYNLNQPQTSGGSKGGLNAVSTGGSTNQLRAFDVNANGWTLQQFNFHLDRSSDGGVGFVSDLNFGQTADVLRASTRNSNINTAATSNDVVDLTQAFLTYTAPVGSGIALQLGRMVTLLGEEVIPVYNNTNFNESRGLLFTLGEPLTHTGLRGTYTYNDKVAMTLGVNNGWDDVTDNNDGQSVEGELSLNSGDLMGANQSLAFVLNGTYGPEQVNHGNSKRWAIDPVLTYKTPIKGLQLVGEYLYAQETGPVSILPAYSSHGNQFCITPSPAFPVGPTPCGVPQPYFVGDNGALTGPNGTIIYRNQVSWQGAAGYIVYDLNDNIEFATRGEFFDDPNGARTGLRQHLGEFTETLNYKVPAVTGLLARLEYRHDESSAKPFFSDSEVAFKPVNELAGTAGLPAHTYSGQDTFMAAAIYSF